MSPDTERMLAELEAIKAAGTAVCAGLSDLQFNWRPGAGRWSVADCLVHLNTGVTQTLPAFDAAIATAPPARGAGPARYGWLTRLMVRSMEPPPRFRMRTARILEVPAGALYARSAILPEFLAGRDRLMERVRRADGLDLTAVRVISPVNRLFRLPLGGYFDFILAHDRRHLWQARQVRESPGFPRVA